MSIKDFAQKIKDLGSECGSNLRTISDDLFLGLIIILVAFGSFGLGRLSKIEGTKPPIRIENAPEVSADTFSGKVLADTQKTPPLLYNASSGGELVGSKNGTKYYYPWCTGVSRISPANLVHFSSKSDAEKQGYTASATCKGL